MGDRCMYDRTSMLFKRSSFTLLNHGEKNDYRMHQNVHLKHELPSTVFFIIKHYFSFSEMKGSDFVIYNLVSHQKGILIDCLTFINQRQ